MTLDNQVSEICRQCSFHIRALRHVRLMLSRNTAATLACSIVQSRLDYCNSVFCGMSESNVEKLETIQNKLAHVVCGGSRLRSSKEMLMTLHWLPVRSRIKYKLAVLTYKALNMGQPVYLHDELSIYEPVRALRSSGTFQLQVPPTSTNIGRRAFRYSAPEIWNTLPYELRSASFIYLFIRHIHYYRQNVQLKTDIIRMVRSYMATVKINYILPLSAVFLMLFRIN